MDAQLASALKILRAYRNRIDTAILAIERVDEIDPHPETRPAPKRRRHSAARPKTLASMIKKTCTACLQEKPLEEFHIQKHGKYGRHSQCKACKIEALNRTRHAQARPDAADAPKLEIPEDLTCTLCNSPCSSEERYRNHMMKVHGKAA